MVTLHTIDSDAYVLKNRLMHRFDERYGTRLMENDADDLSFLDIIMAANDDDPVSLYAEIKTISGHGLTNEQKNLLYKKYPYFSNTDPECDFDMVIGRLEKFVVKVLETPKEKIAGFSMYLNDRHGKGVLSYFREPFSILRIQKVGKEEMQALLVQNQCALIFEIVTSSSDLDYSR